MVCDKIDMVVLRSGHTESADTEMLKYINEKTNQLMQRIK